MSVIRDRADFIPADLRKKYDIEPGRSSSLDVMARIIVELESLGKRIADLEAVVTDAPIENKQVPLIEDAASRREKAKR